MQPWRVHALAGEELARFTAGVQQAYLSGAAERPDYEYYPKPFFEPFLSRRREIGWSLYSLLNIRRGEPEKMRRQHARNFSFFDAPVGLVCTIHRGLKIGSWLDFGMFLENLMIAARGRDLHTCPQAAFSQYPQTIRRLLAIPEEEIVVCGMAIGHADPDAPENACGRAGCPRGNSRASPGSAGRNPYASRDSASGGHALKPLFDRTIHASDDHALISHRDDFARPLHDGRVNHAPVQLKCARPAARASASALITRRAQSISAGACEKPSLSCWICPGCTAIAPRNPSRRACSTMRRNASVSE